MSVSKLLSDLEKNSLLLISLSGMRSVLERELGLDNILIASDEMVKVAMQAKQANNEDITFPYSYISLTEMQGVKDQTPNKTIRRVGYSMGTTGATKSTVRKAFLFPVHISLDFKYVDNDPYRTIRMLEALVILSQLDAIHYDIVLNDEMHFNCRLELPDTEPIPLADTQSAQSPAGIEVATTFILHTYCGVFSDVASVNDQPPIVQYAVTNITGGLSEILTP